MNTSTRVTTPTDREIRIERNFTAPRDVVWRAFTDPQILARWWGRGHRLDVERMEVKPGGRWRYVEHAPDGSTGFEGRYQEVVPESLIVRSFGWDGMPGHEIIETARFTDLGGGGTLVSSTSVFETTADRDGMLAAGMEAGVNESYAALDRVLEQERAITEEPMHP